MLPCLMGCGNRGRDDLQHYLSCEALWSAVEAATGVDQIVGAATRLGFGAEPRAHIAAAGVATSLYHTVKLTPELLGAAADSEAWRNKIATLATEVAHDYSVRPRSELPRRADSSTGQAASSRPAGGAPPAAAAAFRPADAAPPGAAGGVPAPDPAGAAPGAAGVVGPREPVAEAFLPVEEALPNIVIAGDAPIGAP